MKYKVLPSAAHNFGHAFMSTLNYVQNDYVMSHIAWAVHGSGKDCLEVDLLTGEAWPHELTPEPVLEAVAQYHDRFPKHLESHGIEPTAVVAAKMVFTFHPDERRTLGSRRVGNAWEMPADCVVTIRDDRGKEHQGVLHERCIAEARSKGRHRHDPRRWFRLA